MPKVSRQPCITLAFSLKGFTPVLMIRVSYAVSVPTVTFTTLQTPVCHRHRSLPHRHCSPHRFVCRNLRSKSIAYNREHHHRKQFNSNSGMVSPPLAFSTHSKVSQDFLVYVDTILRAVLIKFVISQQSLVRILEVAKQLHVRIKKQTMPTKMPTDFRLEQNRIVSTILELYGEGLRRKSRILPSTLAALAEVSHRNLLFFVLY